jgi:uncharacterized protein (TIGR00270 family)
LGCDICGKNAHTMLTRIEGTTYRACTECATFGTIIQEQAPKKERPVQADNSVVRSGADSIIRSARERLGLTQEDFARRLAVKTSLLQHWESGHSVPTIDQARGLEKALQVSLLTSQDAGDEAVVPRAEKTAGFTIGDLIKKARK